MGDSGNISRKIGHLLTVIKTLINDKIIRILIVSFVSSIIFSIVDLFFIGSSVIFAFCVLGFIVVILLLIIESYSIIRDLSIYSNLKLTRKFGFVEISDVHSFIGRSFPRKLLDLVMLYDYNFSGYRIENRWGE